MWKTIDFEPNYEVSDLGEVRSKKTKTLKGLRFDRGGYLRVTLYPSGKTYLIHRLVAKTFLNQQEGFNVVNHKDGVKTNNCVDNLEWCNHKHNVNHAYANGLNQYREISGESNPSAKLTRRKVDEIRNLAKDGVSWNDLAKKYDVQYNCIKRIILNITWK